MCTWNEMKTNPTARLQKMKTVNALNLDGLVVKVSNNMRRAARVAKRAPSPTTLRAWAVEVRGAPLGERSPATPVCAVATLAPP